MVFSQENFIRSEKVVSKVVSEANFLIQKTNCAD